MYIPNTYLLHSYVITFQYIKLYIYIYMYIKMVGFVSVSSAVFYGVHQKP